MEKVTNRPRVTIPPATEFRVQQLSQLKAKRDQLSDEQRAWLDAVTANNPPGQIVACNESVLKELESKTGVEIKRENVSRQSEPTVDCKPDTGDGAASA